MKNPLQIIELPIQIIEELIQNENFNSLKPVQCDECKSEKGFARKIFLIKNYRKDDYNLLSYHLFESKKIKSFFLKTIKRKRYIDSAICEKCKSAKIVFDIEFTPKFLKTASEFLNISEDKLKNDLEVVLSKITGHKN